METKQVTAQDFVDAVGEVVQHGHFATDQKMEVFPILKALLSRVRQEAASEKEEEMRRYMEQKIKEAKGIARDIAIRECLSYICPQMSKVEEGIDNLIRENLLNDKLQLP